MDSFESLKQLKKIEPDSKFSQESKLLILSSPSRSFYGPLTVILRGMESSLAIALGSILLIILLGGISIFKFLSPNQTASLNFNNIKAEAQEVNAQIKLANLNYTLTSLSASSSKKASEGSSLPFSPELKAGGLGVDASAASISLNIESALENLSQ